MNAADDIWPGQHQQVVIAFQVVRMFGKALATVIGFLQIVALDHGPHRPIEDEEALGKQSLELGSAVWLEHGHLD